jgi:hypothetical protein
MPESLPLRRPGGRIRARDVRTIHGNYGANTCADNRHRLTLLRISRVDITLGRYQAHLPPTPSANRPAQVSPTPGPTAPFKPSRIDPLNHEPAGKSATVPFKPSRIDPLNREPAGKSATVPFKPSRIDPLNREPGAFQDPEPPTRTSRPWTRSYPRTHAMRRTRGASAAGKKICAADERR